MRLLAISDIHLEFGPFEFPDDMPDFDVAVFAGDVARPMAAALSWIADQRHRDFLANRPIIYVPGNHEFYRSEMSANLKAGKLAAEELGIHLLAPGAVTIGNVRFIGATLWTDYRLLGDRRRGMEEAARGLNDHRLIRIVIDGANMPFNPARAAYLHKRDTAFIERQLAEPFSGATVVVTHHAPHPDSIQPIYKGDALSPAFASDLSGLILEHQPDLWIHGHDHGSHDFRVGQTRVFANQAGYPGAKGRENPDFDPRCVIEVIRRPDDPAHGHEASARSGAKSAAET